MKRHLENVNAGRRFNSRAGTRPAAGTVAIRRSRPVVPKGRGVHDHKRQLQSLLSLRRELTLELEHCEAELRNNDIEVSDDGDNPAERTAQSITAGTINHLARRVKEVNLALERLVAGSYGICTDCGEPISQNRLKANLTALRCLKCQTAFEDPQRRFRRSLFVETSSS